MSQMFMVSQMVMKHYLRKARVRSHPVTNESRMSRNVFHQSSESAFPGGDRHCRLGNSMAGALRMAVTIMGVD